MICMAGAGYEQAGLYLETGDYIIASLHLRQGSSTVGWR